MSTVIHKKRDEAEAHRKAWDTRGRAQQGEGSLGQSSRGDWAQGEGDSREFEGRMADPLWKKPRPEYDYGSHKAKGYADMYDDPDYHAFRKNERAWIGAMREAVSLGEISPDEAHKRGWNESSQVIDLPAKMYHVTTAADAVMREGLKTRKELNQEQGVGLGGGDADTVSFTVSPEIAKGIHRAISDARDFMSGETTIEDLDRDAREGGTTGGKSFAHDFEKFFAINAGKHGDLFREGYDPSPVTSISMRLDSIPKDAKVWGHTWQGGDGNTYVSGYHPKLVPGSEREKQLKWDFFRSYVTARAQAGGPMDPLFFSSDAGAIGRLRRQDIQIIEVTPRRGTRGFKMGALGEIRVWTGKITRRLRIVRDHNELGD